MKSMDKIQNYFGQNFMRKGGPALYADIRLINTFASYLFDDLKKYALCY